MAKFGKSLAAILPAVLIIFLANLNAFFIFLIIAPKTLSLIIWNTKNEFINVVKFSMKVLNFSAPSSPKILPTIFSAPSTSLYPKSTALVRD